MELGIILGGRFTGMYPTIQTKMLAKQVWQEALKWFPDKVLQDAAMDCVNFPKEAIFNLAEFKAICNASSRRLEKPIPSLPAPPRSHKQRQKASDYYEQICLILANAGAELSQHQREIINKATQL